MLSLHETESRKLIRMRNPWGKGVWKSSDAVVSKLNSELQAGPKDDAGIFFMPFEKLQTYFDEISIGHYFNNYFYTQKRHKYTDNDMVPFLITISSPGEYYFTVSKPDKRFIWGPSSNSFISVVLVMVSDDSTAQYVGGIGGTHRDPFFKAWIIPGTYIAFVRFLSP